ncbi:hypothetical protein [Acidithiobacillus sulfurivorans]|uniref:Uncharacterized protein n=1 Tax=Acidithiobacillus sulfurivorans TaxID=1958756 RepID=A0ABS6A0C9_9PROT|nr:hypothetical protein [Acidithiobacillus sulfurivorans]MBU2760943.1 hypothetical protein [Acidithiobacillus sulfurivorans]
MCELRTDRRTRNDYKEDLSSYLLHDMEDIGKGVVVDAAVHEGGKIVEHEAEKKAAETSGKIYSKHIINRKNAGK